VPSQNGTTAEVEATKQDSDPLFWFWFREGNFEKVGSELSSYVHSTYLGESQQADIHCATLSFYKTFQLLRITDSSMTKPRRSYALYWPAKDGFQVVPLNGTSVPIHETNRIPGELNLVEDTADEYLRFFCSAVHSQDGPFLILDVNNYDVVLGDNTAVSETLKEELRRGIRSEADPKLEGEFARLSNPFLGSSIKRRKACVFYSSALFRAWFVIDDSPENPGMVQMVDDEPILAGLKVNIPRYSDGSLFVLRKFADKRSSGVLPVPSDEEAKSSDKEPKPTHYHSDCNYKQSDTERDKVVKLLKNLTGSHTRPDGKIEPEVVFRSDRNSEGNEELLIRKPPPFAGPVRIENWIDPRPLVFDNCDFDGGFFARGARIDRDIIFIDCTFGPLTGYAGCENIALDFSNARIRGDLVFFNCAIEGRLFAPGLKAKSNVRLQGCRIVSAGQQIPDPIRVTDISKTGSTLADDSDASLVVFDRAAIRGNFEIFSAGAETVRRISLDQPRRNKKDSASIIMGGLSCERIEVEGSVALCDLIIVGPAFFDASHVTGDFEFGWAQIGDVSLYGATIGGYCLSMGLHCVGDMNLNFLSSNYLAAYRDSKNSKVLGGRESLHIGKDLLLSGAKIGFLELRAVKVERYLKARTGEFGSFTFGLGIEPAEKTEEEFLTAPCTARAVSLTSIRVRETLDVRGIHIVESRLREPTEDKRNGFELLNSHIDGAVIFFAGDRLAEHLQARWGPKTINWKDGGTGPESNEYPSRIKIGDLVVRACSIGGDLDLRHVQLDGGGVLLNDTSVGLHLKVGAKGQFSDRKKKDFNNLTTACLYLGAERVSCRGDVDLAGIQVGKEVVSAPNEQSSRTRRVTSQTTPSERDKTQNLDTEVKKWQVGNVSLRGSHIEGDLLLVQTREAGNGRFASIPGVLDLTAVHCEKLIFSGSNFVGPERSPTGKKDKEPRAILERGHFSQFEILDWSRHIRRAVSISALWRFLRRRILASLRRLGLKLVRLGKLLGSIVILLIHPLRLIRSVLKRFCIFIWSGIRSISHPIDLRQVAVDSWNLGKSAERARHYVKVLREMDPEDRSTWIGVESGLRNKSLEWQADRIYLAMIWNSKRRLRRERKILLRFLSFPFHLFFYWAQRCFLWAKAFFGVPLAFAIMTIFGLSFLFTEPSNVRATVGYLHALPTPTRMKMTDANEIHPNDLGVEWNKWDAFALAVRYHVPLFESRTHDRWEASEDEACIRGSHLGVKMETIAFAVEVTYWVVLPILLLGFVAWAFRKRNTE
jgi:hypothetical protein